MITRNHARYCVSFCLSIPAISRCCKTRRYWIPPALRPSVLMGMNLAVQKYGLTVLGPSHRNLASSEYFNLFAVSRSSMTLRRSKNQSSNFKLSPGSVAFNQTSASTSNFRPSAPSNFRICARFARRRNNFHRQLCNARLRPISAFGFISRLAFFRPR
jgi:hypothetical protein